MATVGRMNGLGIGAAMLCVAAFAMPAAANDDCIGHIASAWAKVGEVPAYRQVVAMSKQNMRMEMAVIGNTLYSSAGGPVQRIELKPGGRKAIVERFAGMTQTLSCSQIGEEAIDGRPTLVYDFTRMPLPGLETGPVRQTVWIGKADGLVRRLASADVTVDVSYEDVTPPR